MIEWSGKSRFNIGRTSFISRDLVLGTARSSIDSFVIQKPVWMIKRYEKLIKTLQPKKIIELGIQQGGSCVFFHELAEVSKLVAIDIRSKEVSALKEFIIKNQYEESLVTRYGVDQGDHDLLREIAAAEFSGELLDLVIDDASHFLDETRTTFNALFPLLREGGAYVVEDWSWAHAMIGLPDDAPLLFPEKEPLTKLIFQLILACPSTHQFIDKIVIDKNSAIVWRGKGLIEKHGFDVKKCSLSRGRDLIASNQ